MTTGGDDKRRAVRVPVDFEVRFTFENKEILGRALNLSPDGMFLKTDYMLLQGDVIEVFFELPGVTEPLWTKARIVWGTWVEGRQSTLSGMGIQFLEPLPSQREALEHYINKLLNN